MQKMKTNKQILEIQMRKRSYLWNLVTNIYSINFCDRSRFRDEMHPSPRLEDRTFHHRVNLDGDPWSGRAMRF